MKNSTDAFDGTDTVVTLYFGWASGTEPARSPAPAEFSTFRTEVVAPPIRAEAGTEEHMSSRHGKACFGMSGWGGNLVVDGAPGPRLKVPHRGAVLYRAG